MSLSTSYFLQPCYFSRGHIGWTRDHAVADFFAVYSGNPWGPFQFISGHETAFEGLSEIQKLLANAEPAEVSAELAPPFPQITPETKTINEPPSPEVS